MVRNNLIFKSGTLLEEPFYLNQINNLIQDSSFLKMISNNGKSCIEQKQGLFPSTLYNMQDMLFADCIHYELNKTFGCLPAFKTELHIRLERDLSHFQYTICPINESKIYLNKMIEKTVKMCEISLKLKPFCEKQIFNVFNNHRINDKNFTQINIFPKNNFIPVYQQKYKMDFNDFIYNCGGIIGLWFGWSAKSLSIALLYILHNFKLYYRNLRAYHLMKKRDKSINHNFIKINNYQVHHQDHKHNYFIILMHKLFNCGKIVEKLFVKSVLFLIRIMIFVGKYFVKYYKQIKVFYNHIKR